MTEKEILNFETDITETSVKWLWYPYIPLGKITIMQGHSGMGKTMLALNIAATLSKGEQLPGDTQSREPINIIYNTAEDGLGDTIKPRLRSAGADLARINTINERVNTLTMTDERLESSVSEIGAKLLILDPIQAYLGAKIDMNKANEVRPIFKQLARVAEDNECAIVLIGHQGKNQMYSEQQSLLGSIDQVAAARSVLTVTKQPNDKMLSLINHTKSSLSAKGKSLSFYTDENCKVVWGDFIENGGAEFNDDKSSKRDSAKEFLEAILMSGPVPASGIFMSAAENEITEKTLQRAKKDLGIISFAEGKKWFWKLPKR
ncbi:MAG: AAA family ATPase [Oscillospiraceae bacterium]|nr:AAA family ATPase [Oscillospiraceae bacterium]